MQISFRDIKTAAEEKPYDGREDYSRTKDNNPKQHDVPKDTDKRRYLFRMDPRRKQNIEKFLPLNSQNMKNNIKAPPN